MSENSPWTVGRLLKWTADYLKENGADSPRLDAEVLLAHARGCQRIELYTCFDEVADETLRSRFRELVKRRAMGTPVAYLVGHREFYSKSFRVTPDVLIPRPETEYVLIALLDLIRSGAPSGPALRIVDVGTGSGILAITAALNLPQAEITATDISSAALQVARANAQQHGVAERIHFHQGDLFEGLQAADPFDYIISNPPYIGLTERSSLPRDVVDYEPHQALFAGESGLDVLERLIAAASHHLRPGGWLVSEYNPAQTDNLRALVHQHPVYEPPKFVDDMTRRPRVMTVRRRPYATPAVETEGG